MIPKNREPMHPGRLLVKVLKDEGLTQAQLADKIGVSIGTVGTLVNEKRGMTAALAIKLAKAFDASPEMWMGLQMNYELWHAAREQAARR